jgi:hypothetical protein
MAPLTGKRPTSAVGALRQKRKRRRWGLRPSPRALELRLAPVTGLTSLGPRAYVIDMEQVTQTVANSLKPYGMVYDLVKNQHTPVDWAINPSKAVFRADFSAGGKSYSVGSFIVESQYAAGIPQYAGTIHDPSTAAYVFGNPTDLSQCNDIYAVRHADPSQWPQSYKTALNNFVNQGGRLSQACHPVSDMDVNVTRFLDTGLILYKSHKNGTPPFNDNPAAAADLDMQFTTRIDAAPQNGSEQIYVPSSWCYGWLRPESVSNSDRRLRFPVSPVTHYQGFHNVYPLPGLAARRV